MMCPTLAPAVALACLLALAPLGHIPVFQDHLVMGAGAVRGQNLGGGGALAGN